MAVIACAGHGVREGLGGPRPGEGIVLLIKSLDDGGDSGVADSLPSWASVDADLMTHKYWNHRFEIFISETNFCDSSSWPNGAGSVRLPGVSYVVSYESTCLLGWILVNQGIGPVGCHLRPNFRRRMIRKLRRDLVCRACACRSI